MPTKIPQAELLDRLREFADELGRTPTTHEMDAEGPHCSRVYKRRFGSWNDALERAGLDTRRPAKASYWQDDPRLPDEEAVTGVDDWNYRLEASDAVTDELDAVSVEELAELWDCQRDHARALLRGRSSLRFRDYLAALDYQSATTTVEEHSYSDEQYGAVLDDLRLQASRSFSSDQFDFLLDASSARQKLSVDHHGSMYVHEAFLIDEACHRVEEEGEDPVDVVADLQLQNKWRRGDRGDN